MNDRDCEALDRADPIAHLREAFLLPGDTVYLDGNSLGALPAAVPERLQELVTQEWGRDLIGSWNRHDWIGLPRRVGEKIAPLLGAAPGQVTCCDSISVNLFKLLSAALQLNPGRTVILSQGDNFPTDLYTAQGLSQLLGEERCRLRTVAAPQLAAALDAEVALLMLTHVNFRDGRIHDMRALTRAAHDAGALVLWDLAHSAGVLPLHLDDWEVDLAVGCGYKFLNGGPGAPAFLYVAQRHQGAVQPLAGWMGHAAAFDFSPDYVPAEGIDRYLSGTPGILGMSALDAALDLFAGVKIAQLRAKSTALTSLFIESLRDRVELADLILVSPPEAAQRGSQVSLAHPSGYAIAQALIAAGVIVDFRAPDILRFGFSPMYNRFADTALALDALSAIMREGRYLDPVFNRRSTVT